MDQNLYLSHMHKQITNSRVRVSQLTTQKVKNILNLLNSSKIDQDRLQSCCFQGIPDECNGLRSLCWKILLGYLPPFTSKWSSLLEVNRSNYRRFLGEYSTQLAASSKSRAECNTLWDEISKDTRRTRAGMHFFQNEVSPSTNQASDKENVQSNSKETHSSVLARILYVYGRLNPEVGYVQGMNEILAPIYYCFCMDQNPAFIGHAEADSFYCFSILMGELKDAFTKSFAQRGVGIQARIVTLNDLLKKADIKLWTHLENCDVNPQFYTLRWLMLMVTQEFPLIEVLRLWDTLLSHPKKLSYVNYICVAMIQATRSRLLRTDEFTTLMEILQRETTEDVEGIIAEAFKLYKKHAEPKEIVRHIVFPN